ncbi:sensor histidine kinase [Paenibacillus psychroresistens]|uniref:Sensor histidine kinase n=1 Tax=Paenibacillus psychroresistens TaxID=1778678 RepID=A0A6B8RR77_9BACL|nr:sensor histidine kinase [Paenibacillus psychroresistens]QGQ97778.1 sensor histidine kinase [Paenibacillus psychroresistens]
MAWFKNQLIRNKIFMVYIPLIIVPLFIVGYLSNRVFTEVIIDKTIMNTIDESHLIITRMNNLINNSESCSNIVLRELNNVYEANEKLFQNPKDDLQFESKKNEFRGQIRSRLDFALMVFPEVESIAFLDTNSYIYSTNDNLERELEQALISPLLRSIDKTSGTSIWFPVQIRDYLVSNTKQPVITLGKKIINISTQEMLGYLILNVKESTLSSIFDKTVQGKQTGYYIVDNSGIIVSPQSKMNFLQREPNETLREWIYLGKTDTLRLKIAGNNKLVTSTVFRKMGWRLVNEIPLKELTADTKKLTIIVIVIGIVCLVFALLAAGILSRYIAKPLVNLTRSVNTIRQGNLDIQYENDSSDEVGLLAARIKYMVSRIKDLIDNLKDEQKKKREYELALMQAQVKPHFLYNCLDLIYVLSDMGESREARDATKALADFYRVSLSRGHDIITIDREIENVKNYLYIQKVRYSNVFDFEIEVEEAIVGQKIPKLTIQPLVENAIYHGIKPKRSFGKLIIRAFRDQDKIILKVIDDGVGMTEDTIKRILAYKQQEENRTTFGLTNVDERIKLYFGESYGMTIKSEVGKGTDITVVIPANVVEA